MQETQTNSAKRTGIALCLSGGGFRAALFHLGALRRLNETGVLRQLKTISSVSGGSIIAAHLATCLQHSAERVYDDWENFVAAPFRAFTAQNIRTAALLKRGWPWHWGEPATSVRALATRYERDLTGLRLRDLPAQPWFIFCATDLTYGVNWSFEKTHLGDYQVGYAATPANWPVALAVAASSCFPPVFNPLPVDLSAAEFKGGKALRAARARHLGHLELSDGGLYDNLGLEPVWKDHQFVLVSDGGAPFAYESNFKFHRRLLRYTEIVTEQAGALRKRWLMAGFNTKSEAGTPRLNGAYWGITNTAKFSSLDQSTYQPTLVKEIIARMRTDLDAFSTAESAVLENHGYLLAASALARRVLTLAQPDVPLKVPHPDWLEERQVRAALACSHKRKLWGRF